jgi:carbonic anhydrase/acetyltransferase-like protein (isoleucine patch superfamily)
MPKVRIGANSLVGAHSLVTQDVPDNSVVIGSPAKKVKNIKDIECPLGIVERPYPWGNIVKRNYPWAKNNES